MKETNNQEKPRKILVPSKLSAPVRNAVVLPTGKDRDALGSGVITGVLGSGGMANVYEIWNNDLEVSRAVKLLHPNYTEETKQRFQTEIKITAKLHHPNIIEIHAVGHWNSLPYIEMEKLSGETRESTIEQRGSLPLEVCTSIGIMVGRALRYAHNQDYAIYGTTYHGVIHRDLKPSNIMITDSGVVKLMDFGIARPTDASIHTTDGSILGTMQYLSPEQLDGQEPDIRADIYSLGAIMYEMLTGVKAFPDSNVSKLMMCKIKNDYASLSGFNIAIPARLRSLVHRCLSQDREKRIPDSETFLEKLDRIHQKISAEAPEEVVHRFLQESAMIYHVASSKNQVYKKMAVVGGVVALFSLGIWQGQRALEKYIDQKKETEQVSSIPESDIVEEKEDAVPEIPVQTAPVGPVKRSIPKTTVQEKVIPASEATPVKEVSLRDSLIAMYGTSDLLSIFSMKVQQNHFGEALHIYPALNSSELNTARATVLYARVLHETGQIRALRELLSTTTFKDGELFLERARLALSDGKFADGEKWLSLCEHTPGAFIESQALRVERVYLEAKCKSGRFDRNNSDELRRSALDGWYEVQAALRTSRDHPYFREAQTEMQRITAKKVN